MILPILPISTVDLFTISTSLFEHNAVSFTTLKVALGKVPFTVNLTALEAKHPALLVTSNETV